ncbi:MAG: sugar phosphate isomerase/epimerase [Dysgonamonadaceae bacterium]|jgi:sugar phosphate isomerase/epimerase|nr:sugar phosphate isomerase/epimerase [Dysgonamonadaceae bacterium]
MKTNAVLLIAVAVALSACSPCSKKNNCRQEKNIGLQLYSLRDDINKETIGIDSVITEVGKMGYKYVESASYQPAEGTIYGIKPEEFKAKAEAAGLIPLACHVVKNLDEDYEKVMAWWDKCIAVHKAAGMSIIVQPAMETPETLDRAAEYAKYFNEVGEKCNAAGMKFGYHNHAYEFETKYELPNGKRITLYDYLLQNTDPEKVFFELDVYWAVIGRTSPVALFKKYPGRFYMLHIKDEKELGESGMVGFDAIFKNVETAGTKYLIVEVERYDKSPLKSVAESLDYLNKAEFVKEDYSK